MSSIEESLQELSDKWGRVYIKYTDYGVVTVRNTTDEGLPVQVEPVSYTGESLSEALDKALTNEFERE